jgi:ketosteroid isomerase-like protein
MIEQHILQEFYEARARSDISKHLSLVSPDCVFRIVGSERLSPFTQQRQGMAELTATAEMLFETWDMSQVKTISIHQSDDTVYVHQAGTVVYRPNGIALDTEFLDKLTFRDGAIIEYLQFVDTFAVSELLNAQPGRPSETSGGAQETRRQL